MKSGTFKLFIVCSPTFAAVNRDNLKIEFLVTELCYVPVHSTTFPWSVIVKYRQNIKYIWKFPTKFDWNFEVIKRIQRDIIINVYRSSNTVTVAVGIFLCDFNFLD
jgi:hypothetical protein